MPHAILFRTLLVALLFVAALALCAVSLDGLFLASPRPPAGARALMWLQLTCAVGALFCVYMARRAGRQR